MPESTFDEILDAWAGARSGGDSPEALAWMDIHPRIFGLLADGQPVSAEQLASASGVSGHRVAEILRQLRDDGAEFNDRGELVGLVLTLNPTPHGFRVGGRDLFAWCSLDTMFLPGLIGRRARVRSTCPVTGSVIELTVSPTGIEDVSPPDTVLSVCGPATLPETDAGPLVGPNGAI